MGRTVDPCDCTGLVDLKGPNAARVGLRHVEFGFVGREADAVRAVERRDYPSDGGAVGGRVINRAAVDCAAPHFAMIREPKSAI